MFRVHVTGTYNGKQLDSYCDMRDTSPSDGAQDVFAHVAGAGRVLYRRTRGWHVSHSRGKPLTITLFDKDGYKETIFAEIIGRA